MTTPAWSKRLKFSVKNVEGTLGGNRPSCFTARKRNFTSPCLIENADVVIEDNESSTFPGKLNITLPTELNEKKIAQLKK